MDSSDLYHVKQQFTLGLYKPVANLTLPAPSSEEYDAFLLYKARALLALGKPAEAEALIPPSTEALPLKAMSALARFVASGDADESALEELRDLCVEVEADEGDEVGEQERNRVRVLAATAFVRAGEVEEALETLGFGATGARKVEDLEATAFIVQICLSLARPDLARSVYNAVVKAPWAEDDTQLQAIEAALGLSGSGSGTGSGSTTGYAGAAAFYAEQLANPGLSNPARLLVARGVARLLGGEVEGARSDFEEVLKGGDEDAVDEEEALCASVVVAGLQGGRKGEAEELFGRLSTKYPRNPLVLDVARQSDLFDECAARFEVPARA